MPNNCFIFTAHGNVAVPKVLINTGYTVGLAVRRDSGSMSINWLTHNKNIAALLINNIGDPPDQNIKGLDILKKSFENYLTNVEARLDEVYEQMEWRPENTKWQHEYDEVPNIENTGGLIPWIFDYRCFSSSDLILRQNNTQYNFRILFSKHLLELQFKSYVERERSDSERDLLAFLKVSKNIPFDSFIFITPIGDSTVTTNIVLELIKKIKVSGYLEIIDNEAEELSVTDLDVRIEDVPKLQDPQEAEERVAFNFSFPEASESYDPATIFFNSCSIKRLELIDELRAAFTGFIEFLSSQFLGPDRPIQIQDRQAARKLQEAIFLFNEEAYLRSEAIRQFDLKTQSDEETSRDMEDFLLSIQRAAAGFDENQNSDSSLSSELDSTIDLTGNVERI
ncbi:MAG: hypothetical protein SFT93_05360 [Rickettsiaceae bacterium]|nr:hypothetical protein [Rickettsiaceae bacterium]